MVRLQVCGWVGLVRLQVHWRWVDGAAGTGRWGGGVDAVDAAGLCIQESALRDLNQTDACVLRAAGQPPVGRRALQPSPSPATPPAPLPQVLACPPDTELVFYGPQALLVEASVEPADSPASAAGGSADGGDPLSSTDSDSEAAPVAGAAAAAAEEAQGFGALSVMRRGGLRPAKELRLKCGGEAGRSAIADVAVSGERSAAATGRGEGLPAEGDVLLRGAHTGCLLEGCLAERGAWACSKWWACCHPAASNLHSPGIRCFPQACPDGSRCTPAAATRRV